MRLNISSLIQDTDAKVAIAEKDFQLQQSKYDKAEEEKQNAINEGRDPELPKDFIVPQRVSELKLYLKWFLALRYSHVISGFMQCASFKMNVSILDAIEDQWGYCLITSEKTKATFEL